MLILTKIAKCPHCASENIVKNGFTRHHNQRVLCKSCGKTRVLNPKKAQFQNFEELRRAFLERLSLYGVSRVFMISYYQVYQHLNLTCLLLPYFKTQVSPMNSPDIIEFDELCSFCGSKKQKQWLWAALSRKTRQIVAYVIGDRSEQTFKRLIRKIPIEYLKCQSYSDYWKSYAILKAKGNHQQVAKKSGKTNHIERFWATLRARISRFVRKSLSFSRKLKYHHLMTKLFIVNYNQECINSL